MRTGVAAAADGPCVPLTYPNATQHPAVTTRCPRRAGSMVGKGKIAKGKNEEEFVLFTGGFACCCCVIPAFILIGFAFNGHHTPETCSSRRLGRAASQREVVSSPAAGCTPTQLPCYTPRVRWLQVRCNTLNSRLLVSSQAPATVEPACSHSSTAGLLIQPAPAPGLPW